MTTLNRDTVTTTASLKNSRQPLILPGEPLGGLLATEISSKIDKEEMNTIVLTTTAEFSDTAARLDEENQKIYSLNTKPNEGLERETNWPVRGDAASKDAANGLKFALFAKERLSQELERERQQNLKEVAALREKLKEKESDVVNQNISLNSTGLSCCKVIQRATINFENMTSELRYGLEKKANEATSSAKESAMILNEERRKHSKEIIHLKKSIADLTAQVEQEKNRLESTVQHGSTNISNENNYEETTPQSQMEIRVRSAEFMAHKATEMLELERNKHSREIAGLRESLQQKTAELNFQKTLSEDAVKCSNTSTVHDRDGHDKERAFAMHNMESQLKLTNYLEQVDELPDLERIHCTKDLAELSEMHRHEGFFDIERHIHSNESSVICHFQEHSINTETIKSSTTRSAVSQDLVAEVVRLRIALKLQGQDLDMLRSKHDKTLPHWNNGTHLHMTAIPRISKKLGMEFASSLEEQMKQWKERIINLEKSLATRNKDFELLRKKYLADSKLEDMSWATMKMMWSEEEKQAADHAMYQKMYKDLMKPVINSLKKAKNKSRIERLSVALEKIKSGQSEKETSSHEQADGPNLDM